MKNMIALLLISFSLAMSASFATNNDVGYADQHRVTVSTGTNYQTVAVQALDELGYRPQLQPTTQISYNLIASEATQTTVTILPKNRDVDCWVSLNVNYKNKNSSSEQNIYTSPRTRVNS